MEQIDLLRRAAQRNTARVLGLDPRASRQSVAQIRAVGNEADILAYPLDLTDNDPVQVLTGGADFGKFYFLPDYDTPGDPTKAIR